MGAVKPFPTSDLLCCSVQPNKDNLDMLYPFISFGFDVIGSS